MWTRLKLWNHERKSRKFQRDLAQMKAVANKCCASACADPICQQVGCLNQDGFTLRHRIKLLLKRNPCPRVEARIECYECGYPLSEACYGLDEVEDPGCRWGDKIEKPSNVVYLADHKK